jgi:hypothetical protein
MQETHLSHKCLHTLQQIFQHPASHNLEWHDVIALINHLGMVQEGDSGHLTFTLHGNSEVFKRSLEKDVAEIQQVLDIRRFLEKAGIKADGTITPSERAAAQESSIEPEQNAHDQGHANREQNRHAEQQLKTQQNEQNDRSAFQEGNAQAHQQGNRQK